MNYKSIEWPVSQTPIKISTIKENEIVEIADLGRENPEIIKLWIGESDLKTPKFICDATTKALREGHTRYTFSRGISKLHDALKRYHKRHWGVDIEANRFSITAGGVGAIMQAFQAILDNEDEVVIPSPVWPNVLEVVRINGGKVKHVQFDFDLNSGFSLDLNKIISAITPKTRAIYINSPGNPTGWVMPRNDMVQLLAFARERGLWLISDEVYNHFTFDRPIADSFLEISEPNDRLIVTNTFSKNWCMTGWRIGWMIFPKVMEVIFDNLGQYNTTSVSTFLQHGAIKALDDGDKFVKDFVKRSKIGRDIICSALERAPKVNIVRPNGTFYAMFSVQGMDNGMEMAKKILHEVNVGVAPGSAFGTGAESYLRLCFGVDHALLTTAADRLSSFFENQDL